MQIVALDTTIWFEKEMAGKNTCIVTGIQMR